MSKIKSYRGLIADTGIDTISLHTNNGSIGYRIVKLQLMPEAPGTADCEHIVKVYSTPQASTSSTIDLNDSTILAVGLTGNSTNITQNISQSIIIDNMIFNQDIDITHVEVNSNKPVNYYIELEQMKLDLNENTVATLKDIRNIKSQ